MTLNRNFAARCGAAFLCLLLCAGPSWAADAEDHFLLTPALLQKLKSAAPDIKKLEKAGKDEDDGPDNLSVDEFARKIEAEPRAKAVLAKHGLGVREFALATYAMVHAGMYVGLEPSMNKKQAAEMFASFTKEQKANIALVRKAGPLGY